MSVEAQVRPPTSTDRSTDRSSVAAAPGSPQLPIKDSLQPCAATAAYFLFAQGAAILSLHHDTLALDRRFESHQSDVIFITVDNVSEKGAGRLVISYDVGQTGIVWDLFTGNEISRFASFEHIRVAAWMRNGNVAFGNARGEVVLFEPSTSEHISSRTIFDPITALAPATDCQTHAIGYLNGSILITTLQPNFTILHTLSTSRGPSPIVSLAWHASSTKQKSDMLATQSVDGDLSLWSVSKKLGDAPRVIRSLKRSEARSMDSKWLSWSKNGRIIQYSDGETWSWDVRTKHVTYEIIPTVQGVKGLANYGPTATLFTLGPNDTVQQYDIASKVMLANVQHVPGTSVLASAAPTPVNENKEKSTNSHLTSQNLSHLLGEDKGKTSAQSPQPTTTDTINRERSEQLASPLSTQSQTNSRSSGESSHRRRYQYKTQAAKSLYSGTSTSFSTGSPFQSFADTSLYSGSSLRYGSITSPAPPRSHRGGSRLRNELLNSPEEEDLVIDLFPYVRNRLIDLPYSPPQQLDESTFTPDQLRKQMLNVVFGWEGDIEDLIRDEVGRHPAGSPRAIILSRWLGHIDTDLMTSMSGSVTSSYMDWMLLALSQLGNHCETKTIGRSFVQRLLSSGDIHASVAVLLGLGDGNDAVEVYVSRAQYMEAILLTCLLMPSEWRRLSYLVRKWGEHVVQNSQQHLAIRCFSCTAADPPEPWSSPSLQMTSILSDQLSSQSPPVPAAPMPPSTNPTPASSRPKNQSLKLITSFSPNPPPQFNFPGLSSADRTPTNAPGVTPIDSAHVDSATSPGGSYRTNGARSINQTLSAKSLTPSSYAKHRLPSIGETPTDVMSPTFAAPKSLPTPGDSGSEKGKRPAKPAPEQPQEKGSSDDNVEFLSPARYKPDGETLKETPETAFPTGVSTQPEAVQEHKSTYQAGNESRDSGNNSYSGDQYSRDETQLNGAIFTDPFAASREQQASPPQEPSRSATASPGKTSTKSITGTSISGRSIDEYISSLDEATYYSRKQRSHRHGGTDADSATTKQSSTKGQSRGRSNQRYIQPAKRSPSSPVPMSPQDIALYSSGTPDNTSERPKQHKSRDKSKQRSTSSTGRKRSKAKGDRDRKKSASRPESPDRGLDHIETSRRSRSRHKSEGFGVRSPSSPVPMSASAAGNYEQQPYDEDDKLKLVNAERKHRLHSRERSSARRKERSTSARRDPSPDRRRDHERSKIPLPQEPADGLSPYRSPGKTMRHRYSQSTGGEPLGSTTPHGYPFVNRSFNQSTGNISRKEQAAAELEARRLSLARRPSAPAIPQPGDFRNSQHAFARSYSNSEEVSPMSNGSFSQRISGKKPSPPYSTSSDPSSLARVPCTVPVGLPSTPRAMRHPKFSVGYADQDIPAVPSIPDSAMGTAENLESSVRRTMSAPIPDGAGEATGVAESTNIAGLPAHPHFNRQLPSSKVQNVTIPQRRQTGQYQQQQPSPPANTDAKPGERTGSEAYADPPLLPELQHLHTPPPPPPPPAPPASGGEANFSPAGEERHSIASGSGVGTINIAIDNTAVENSKPGDSSGGPTQRPATTDSARGSVDSGSGAAAAAGNGNRRTSMSDQHRRGRSINENLSSRIRTFTDRMRSTSRSRTLAKSPPVDNSEAQMPYESVKMIAK